MFTISMPPKTILGYKKSGLPIYNIAGGSEPLGDPGYAGGQGGDNTGEGQQGNPSWNEYLQDIPQELHEKVTPAFQKWDQNVQQRFDRVQSEWEPWKGLRESGIDPETAQFGVNLVSALQNNPQMIYNALKEHYNFDSQQPITQQPNNLGQGQDEPQDDPFAPYNQRISQLEYNVQRAAEIMQADNQRRMQEQADTNLASELEGLASKYKDRGPFDEQFVLSQMMGNGGDAEKAVQAFYDWQERMVGQYRPKPLLLGSGGGVPGGQMDPRKLSDSQTKNLVADMLQQTLQQNR